MDWWVPISFVREKLYSFSSHKSLLVLKINNPVSKKLKRFVKQIYQLFHLEGKTKIYT